MYLIFQIILLDKISFKSSLYRFHSVVLKLINLLSTLSRRLSFASGLTSKLMLYLLVLVRMFVPMEVLAFLLACAFACVFMLYLRMCAIGLSG